MNVAQKIVKNAEATHTLPIDTNLQYLFYMFTLLVFLTVKVPNVKKVQNLNKPCFSF